MNILLQELLWLEDYLPQDSYIKKSMFGGKAYYINNKIIMLIFASEGDNTYKGHVYNFSIWHGVMFPAEKIFHSDLLVKFPFLINHPILPKWLYLSIESEDFEENAKLVIKDILKYPEIWGSTPKIKKSRATKKQSSKKIKKNKPNLKQPQIFRDKKS
ncbi:MAG: hypothetical protein ACK41T_07130 [Pseudobdellovibrio sp.]